MPRFFKKIIKSFKGDVEAPVNIVFDDDEVNTSPTFYIPQSETLAKVNNKMPLSKNEINDYLNYIIKNYFLHKTHNYILLDFASEWAKFGYSSQVIDDRKQTAHDNIINRLEKGETVNLLDILWLSDKVFVDDSIVDNRRIITQEVVDDRLQLNIETQRKNVQVGIQIETLKRELKDKMLSKAVANNL